MPGTLTIDTTATFQAVLLTTTQRYLHPDHRAITDASVALSAYLNAG
jgi:hypothetical protein